MPKQIQSGLNTGQQRHPSKYHLIKVETHVRWDIQVGTVGGLSFMGRRGELAFCYRPAINSWLFIKQNHSYENE